MSFGFEVVGGAPYLLSRDQSIQPLQVGYYPLCKLLMRLEDLCFYTDYQYLDRKLYLSTSWIIEPRCCSYPIGHMDRQDMTS
jgi:hypothetical protein